MSVPPGPVRAGVAALVGKQMLWVCPFPDRRATSLQGYGLRGAAVVLQPLGVEQGIDADEIARSG